MRVLLTLLVAACALIARADESSHPAAGFVLEENIPYRTGEDLDPYARERCVLDVYAPAETPPGSGGFATVVWFHAGGLTSGEKWIPHRLRAKGIAIVAANYRLSPKVQAPVYIQDAAAAVAWTLDNIHRYGGDPDKVVVSGHSAGGYLAAMVGMDPTWLEPHGHHPDRLAGLAPISGHTITHFTVRAERGIPGHQAVIDELAPQYHVRAEAPPIVVITGDRDHELLGRHEENAYFWRMLQVVGHPDATLVECKHFDHSGVVAPGQDAILAFLARLFD